MNYCDLYYGLSVKIFFLNVPHPSTSDTTIHKSTE